MPLTVHEIARRVYPLGTNLMVAARRGETVYPISHGLAPRRLALAEGIRSLDPQELLALKVPVVSANGKVSGYQREFKVAHARKIARAMLDGRPMPPGIVSTDGNLIDGQHRALACLMIGRSFEVVVTRMSRSDQQELFAGQRRALPVDANTLVLSATGPFERYIQDACVNDKNPWHGIVSAALNSKTRISPNQMLQLLVAFVGNTSGHSKEAIDATWDPHLAGQLAPLVSCFGNKRNHPEAFRPTALRGIGQAAMYVFRRREPHVDDRHRWINHMPGFDFGNHAWVRTTPRMTDELLAHWNKRLPVGSDRRVER